VKQIHRVEVAFKSNNLDSVGFSTKKKNIEEDLQIKGIEAIHSAEVYYFELEMQKEKIKEISERVLIDPLTQNFSINENVYSKYDYFIEVKLHNDVTDNIGIVSLEGIQDYLGKQISGKIRTAKKFYFEGLLLRVVID